MRSTSWPDPVAGAARAPQAPIGFMCGVRDLIAVILPIVALGAAFGAAASNAGLTHGATLLMSALVFAGASQFAILEHWQAPSSWLALALLVLAVNARHLVLGATLHRYLAGTRLAKRLASLALLSDANWASTQTAMTKGRVGLGHLVGGGVALWLAWVSGTALGIAFQASIHGLDRFGIDAVMPTFFACTVIGNTEKRFDLAPWLSSAILAGCLSIFWPSSWTVLVAAGVGALLGSVRNAPR